MTDQPDHGLLQEAKASLINCGWFLSGCAISTLSMAYGCNGNSIDFSVWFALNMVGAMLALRKFVRALVRARRDTFGGV